MTSVPADKPKRSRRPRRFFTYRIRTLLVLVAVAAVVFFLYRVHVEPYRRQQAFLADVAEAGGSVKLERIGGDGQQRNWSKDAELALLDRVVEVDLFNTGWRRVHAEGWDNWNYVDVFVEERFDFEATLVDPSKPVLLTRSKRTPAIERCLRQLGNLSGLRRLSLRRGDVDDADLAALRGLSELERLDLTATRVTDEGLAHLAGLSNLKHLSLACCRISNDGLSHLKRLTRLETLNLTRTKVTAEGLRALGGIPSLRKIDLGTRDIFADAVKIELAPAPSAP